ncbi:hypothetical protein N8089_02340 [Flavobacteriales bacterium]|nr:hypothetical protein [Flavobacteriales bacterium]
MEVFSNGKEVKKAFKLLTYQYSIHLTDDSKLFYEKAQSNLDIAYKVLSSKKEKENYDIQLRNYLGESSNIEQGLHEKIKSLEEEKKGLIQQLQDKSSELKQIKEKLVKASKKTHYLTQIVNVKNRKGHTKKLFGFRSKAKFK